MVLGLGEAVLWISVVANIYFVQGYFLLRLKQIVSWIIGRAQCKEGKDFVSTKQSEKDKVRKINLFLDCLLTQGLGWMSFILLYKHVIFTPFSTLASPYSKLVTLIFSVHTGRLAYKVCDTFFIECQISKGFYYAIHLVTFLVFLCPGKNALLGLIAVSCEISNICLTIRSLLRLNHIPQHRTCFLFNACTGIILNVTFRGILPVIAMCVAMTHANPLYMNNNDIVLFFFYLTFLLSINIWFIIYSLLKLQEIILIRRLYHLTMSNLCSDLKERSDPRKVYKHLYCVLKDVLNSKVSSKAVACTDSFPQQNDNLNFVSVSSEKYDKSSS